jgi:hypothetical protein
MATTFHFSPRPNRAGEIQWRPWEEPAFRDAAAADKPILLAISAVWCHWCHVMDETTYSDSSVIDYINEHFVPVRVDNDQRPDINARYNMGGWPTTVVLTPEGSILTGGTYVPPPQMLRLLSEIKSFYSENKTQIAQRAETLKERAHDAGSSAGDEELRDSMVARIVEQIGENFDDEYGGFGVEPKFPQTDALELLLLEHRIGGSQRLYEMVAKTMLGMSRGGMYDHVEGGFFRYSTTRDWSVPHFEKMAEDHAGLLRVLTTLCAITANKDFRATLQSTTRYLMQTLYDRTTGFFGGSQDADEAYYEHPLEERRKLTAPYVDRTAYSNWTAGLAGALFGAASILEDDPLLAAATRALDELDAKMRDADGLLFHYLPQSGTPQVRGLLTDQAAYLRALLDAHETTGQARFLERAIALYAALNTTLAAPDAGYFDHAPGGEELGNLSFKDRPLADNALIADCLIRLSALTEDNSYREAARAILSIYSKTYAKAGSFAAGYVRAVRRYLTHATVVKIAGNPEASADFREAARHLPDPLTAIRTTDGDSPAPVAYVCRGVACAAPVHDASEVRTAFESLHI